MIQACKIFLDEQIKQIGYFDNTNVFYDRMPRDFLKDNRLAVIYDLVSDNFDKVSRKVHVERNQGKTSYVYTLQRFERKIRFRCLFYSDNYAQLGEILEEFVLKIAETKKIYDSQNIEIRVELDDVLRSQADRDRKLLRPEKGIVRIIFVGGVFMSKQKPIIQDLNINIKEG